MRKKPVLTTLVAFLVLFSGISVSSVSARSILGHDSAEQYFALVVDLNRPDDDPQTGANVIRDFFDEANEQEDTMPEVNNEFFLSYLNDSGFQVLYTAMLEHSANVNVLDPYEGEVTRQFNQTAPFQILAEHFLSPRGRHVFITITYEGLAAYTVSPAPETPQENKLSRDDEIFMGYTLSGQFLLERLSSVIDTEPYQWNAMPFFEYNEEDHSYMFGVTYTNLLTAWYNLDVSPKQPSDEIYLVRAEHIRSFTLLDELTFRYKVTFNETEDTLISNISSEYDIGEVKLMGILYPIGNDKEITTALALAEDETIDGTVFGAEEPWEFAPNHGIVLYTDGKARGRITGLYADYGLGLSVLSSMNIVRLDRHPRLRLDEGTAQEDLSEVDQDINETVDVDVSEERVFRTDFAAKPHYTLDYLNGTQIPDLQVFQTAIRARRLHTQRMGHFHSITNHLLRRLAMWIHPAIRQRLQSDVRPVYDQLGDIGLNLDHAILRIGIQFPQWDGYRIIHDPVFTAYSVPQTITTSTPGIEVSELESFMLGPSLLIIIVTLTTPLLLLARTRRNR
ncbi:MAG: hypothetical protein ACE5I5_07890 [Candidatus Heimdallarchaeota archaeon]